MSVAQAMLQLLLHAATNVLLRRGHLQHAARQLHHATGKVQRRAMLRGEVSECRRSVHPSILDIRA
jgi:hypothetical protein